MSEIHRRVLVSNLGDGNWGIGSNGHNRIDTDAVNQRTVYFPPVVDASGTIQKHTEPSPSADSGPMARLDNVGWGSKSNWMVQVVFADLGTPPSGSGEIACRVEAVRPTGVAETVLEITGSHAGNDLNGASDGISFTHGGFDSEAITGPVSYFRFGINVDGSTAYGGTFAIDCFVIGWNEGDLSYGLGTG